MHFWNKSQLSPQASDKGLLQRFQIMSIYGEYDVKSLKLQYYQKVHLMKRFR